MYFLLLFYFDACYFQQENCKFKNKSANLGHLWLKLLPRFAISYPRRPILTIPTSHKKAHLKKIKARHQMEVMHKYSDNPPSYCSCSQNTHKHLQTLSGNSLSAQLTNQTLLNRMFITKNKEGVNKRFQMVFLSFFKSDVSVALLIITHPSAL